MTKRFVKPAQQGLVVRQPHNGQPLPAEGAEVHWSGYWVRRLAEGSIIETGTPKKTKAKPVLPAADKKESD